MKRRYVSWSIEEIMSLRRLRHCIGYESIALWSHDIMIDVHAYAKLVCPAHIVNTSHCNLGIHCHFGSQSDEIKFLS